jgi:hypothetical protein
LKVGCPWARGPGDSARRRGRHGRALTWPKRRRPPESVGGAFIAAQRGSDAGLAPLADLLRDVAAIAFFDGFAIDCVVAALGAIVAAVLLSAQPIVVTDEPTPELEPNSRDVIDTIEPEPALVAVR